MQNNEFDDISEEIVEMQDKQTVDELPIDDLAALEATLDELDTQDIIEDVVEELPVEAAEIDESIQEDVVEKLEKQEMRQEIYAQQQATPAPDPEAAEKTKAKRTRRTSGAYSKRSLADVPSEVFVLEGDAAKLSTDELKNNRDAVLAAAPKQTKVNEKFENLFIALSNGRKPSVYVCIAYELLANAGGPVTTADIVSAIVGSGRGEGTAKSQAGQINTLFPLLKISTVSGKAHTINPNSNIAKLISAAISKN